MQGRELISLGDTILTLTQALDAKCDEVLADVVPGGITVLAERLDAIGAVVDRLKGRAAAALVEPPQAPDPVLAPEPEDQPEPAS